MRNGIFVISAFLLLNASCFKKENLVQAEVVRDCTGTYLHINDQHHKVCNQEKVNTFETGSLVMVNFNKAEDCQHDDDVIYCMMLHANAGWVWVTKIKAK